MVSRCIKLEKNKKNLTVWEHQNTGKFLKGTRTHSSRRPFKIIDLIKPSQYQGSFFHQLLMLNHSFLDVDECQPISDCMQICENTIGSYNCKCNADFKVDPSNSKDCIRELHFALICYPSCISTKHLLF